MICERLFGFWAEAVCQRIAPCARSAFGEGPGISSTAMPLRAVLREMAGRRGREAERRRSEGHGLGRGEGPARPKKKPLRRGAGTNCSKR